MSKLTNYNLIKEFYETHFDSKEDNLNKSQSFRESVVNHYNFVIAFIKLADQLRRFKNVLNEFNGKINNQRSKDN